MTDQLDHFKQVFATRYRVERQLGRGAMATVYLAEDLKHHRKVAVKVLLPEVAAALGHERFLREIEIAASLNHPHILPVHESGQIDETFYYVMPYVEGESLREQLERDHRLPLADALQIVGQVAEALDYAHRRGVVHRDIKPGNILMADGQAVVADFGIARAASTADPERLTWTGVGVGTPAYMSPEQATGSGEVDGRSDIYSLGRVLYEMVVGELATSPTDRADVAAGHLTHVPPSHQPLLAALPRPVVRALARALALDPDERFQSAAAFAATLGGVTAPKRPTRSRLVIGLAAVGLGALGLVWLTRRAPAALDPDVVAVAPFDVLDPELSLWHEGLSDLLSATLDGAGTLRTVPPSVVLKRWEGHADPAYAASLGSRVGAGLVVYGRLVGSGTDSARAIGALFDVARRRSLAEFDVRERTDRIDRLADSLAFHIMDELSRIRGFSGWRLASLGSSSPLALKAFLHGEQFYRRFGLDSAKWYFTRALELDSTFALAYSRRATASGWGLEADPEFTPALLRAGALNHGLARRESLLIVADSIRGALSQILGDSTGHLLVRRLLATLELATLQYPSDPSLWYELGEARYHQGVYAGATDQQAHDAFARSVALDSAFVPPYRHQVELALLLHGRDAGRQVAEQYAARTDSSVFRDAAQVTAALLEPQRATSPAIQRALAALPPEGLFQVWYDLKWWPDSAETSARVARAWVQSTDSTGGGVSLAVTLAYRGHLREAYALLDARQPALFVVLAQLGAVSRDTAAAILTGWLRRGELAGVLHAQRWWAEQGDTASLLQAALRWDSLQAVIAPAARPRLEYAFQSNRGYLALARGDTLQALRLLAAIPNAVSRAYFSYYEQWTRARILSRLGRDREAADLLDHMPFERQWAPSAEAVLVEMERGRVHERLGDRSRALRSYTFVVDAWRNPDSQLTPVAAEARSAIARLSEEPRR